MNIESELKRLISEALAALGFSADPALEHPEVFAHGDYSTNVALALAKEAGKNPRELAEAIRSALPTHEFVTSTDVAGPGFINFRLSPAYFANVIRGIDAQFGISNIHAGQKILVEHSSPNLFKPFHIGHMMNNAIGESLVRLMRASGAEVSSVSFPSDISLGVAKAIFVLLEKNIDTENLEISALGDAYVEGTKRFEEDESIQSRVKEIADNLYAGADTPEFRLFKACKEFNIKYFESVVARLGSHFDSYIYESEAGVVGKELVEKYTPKVFTESEGAIVYIPDTSTPWLNTAVFINSQGNPTYEAKDLGLIKMKFEGYHPDLSIFVTDYQQIQHFALVIDAAYKIDNAWANNNRHVPHGRMTFKGQKMSSRLGGVPLATDILDTVSEEVRERSAERALSQEMIDAVAIAAIKFSILKSKPGQNINFDPETSLSFEGDSGPYLQYTHARINSLLEKAREAGITESGEKRELAVSDVERLLTRFPEVVEESINFLAPHHVAIYLLELARAFNSWYGNTKIIDVENVNASYNIALAKAVGQTIHNGLWLLGIKAPERM